MFKLSPLKVSALVAAAIDIRPLSTTSTSKSQHDLLLWSINGSKNVGYREKRSVEPSKERIDPEAKGIADDSTVSDCRFK
jgi:hypothetical protein